MSDVILGSHNSITGEQPSNLFARLLSLFCKCQKLDIIDQLEKGVRCLDIRVWRDSKGNWRYGHGLATYYFLNQNYSPIDLISACQHVYKSIRKGDEPLYIRLILERSCNNGKQAFKDLCENLEKTFPNIIFFEGRDKHSWEVLYQFKNSPTMYEYHASVSGSGLLKIMPIVFYKLFGKDYKMQEGINLLDFV